MLLYRICNRISNHGFRSLSTQKNGEECILLYYVRKSIILTFTLLFLMVFRRHRLAHVKKVPVPHHAYAQIRLLSLG